MWYYTTYDLEIDLDFLWDWDNWIEVDHEEVINKEFDWWINDNCKWYEWESDMKEYSKRYPNIIFMLYWEWEESWDMWKAYFIDWKMQKEEAEIKYNELDFKKLI